MILIGNKSDLNEERKVSHEEASLVAKNEEISYF